MERKPIDVVTAKDCTLTPHLAPLDDFATPMESLSHRLPSRPMGDAAAYLAVQEDVSRDVDAAKNLATFATTSMDPQGHRLVAEYVHRNLVGHAQLADYEQRCIAMLADLWNAPQDGGLGCSTTGSSEACLMGGLALLRRWERRQSPGGRAARPNLVLGANSHVCWEKFCAFWGVEARRVPMHADFLRLDEDRVLPYCDAGTIGVVTVLGSTYDGSYEPVRQIAEALDEFEMRTGLNVPIHVDAASGGMVAPFLDPDLVWDFRLARVASINTSGHKYGLVYPSVGWVLWRDEHAVPNDLIFHVKYLGGELPTLGLSFTRPGAMVAAQYYSFLSLGFDGYREIHGESRATAKRLARRLAATGALTLITDGSDLPVFAASAGEGSPLSVYDLSRELLARGWQVPAYPFPHDREDLHVLRFVIRKGFSDAMADLLVDDVRSILHAAHEPEADAIDLDWSGHRSLVRQR